jgi:hypothetical protein
MSIKVVTRIMLVLTLSFGAAMIVAQEGQQMDEEYLQTLYSEYMGIQQQLQAIQQQAFQDPTISESADDFSDLIDAKLIDLDAEAKVMVERREKIREDMDEARDSEDMESMQQLQQEHQQIEAQLEPLMQTVMQDPEVSAEQSKLETMIINKMVEIEPDASQMFDRIDEITEVFQSMSPQQQ